MKLLAIIGFACAVKYAEGACGGPYAQCAGWGFQGSSCCQSGYKCVKYNEWYSNCVPYANSKSNNKNKKVTKKTNSKKTTKKNNNNNINRNRNNNNNNIYNNNNNNNRNSSSSSSSNANANVSWPRAQKTVKLSSPMLIKAGQTFDGLAQNGGVWTSYGRGVSGQGDCKNVEGGSKDAVFRLETGATLKNVILGKDSIEHVHCIGDGCTVENVWWDDVCEDALSLLGSNNKNAKFYLRGGGARNGSDKIVQHNSAGTVYINGFQVQNSGKLYRSCGNCKNGYQGQRHVVIENVNAKNVGVLAGINTNFGDTAIFKNVNANGGNVCYTFTGNNNGKEPKKTGTKCKGSSSCTCN